MKKILVAGATGYLGKYAVKAMKEAGYYVKVLVRNEKKLGTVGRFGEPAVTEYVDEVFAGEITKPETLKGVCGGMDYVFSSVGITRQKDGLTFMDVDYRGNSSLLKEAVSSGVKKFMFVSVLHPEKFDGIVPEKERFVAELKEAPVEGYVIRPSGYCSDIGEYMKMAKKGRAYLMNKGTARINPIHGSDLARFCAETVEKDPGEYEVGGPKVYSHREIAELAFDLYGKPFKSMNISYGLARFLIKFVKPFGRNSYELASFFTTAMSTDAVGRKYGEIRLEDYFGKLLEEERRHG